MSDKDITVLIKRFKQLVRDDTVGITSIDALNTVVGWLIEIGELKHARRLDRVVRNYSFSPAVEKMIEDYNASGQ